MTIGILKEPSHETSVFLLPEHLAILKKMLVEVIVESTAGEKRRLLMTNTGKQVLKSVPGRKCLPKQTSF